MRNRMFAIMLCVMSVTVFANDIKVTKDDEKGVQDIDTGYCKYFFSTKSNMLINVVKGDLGKNLLSSQGGARWIYHTHSGGKGDRRKAFRQGQVKDPASHKILRLDDGCVAICLSTTLNALQIEEVYTFDPNGPIEWTYEIEAIEDIPDMALFCWEARLGIGGDITGPFDRFMWGKGSAVLRNETELKTAGKVRGPVAKVSNERPWIAAFWIKPSELRERFISLQDSQSGEYWMLAFEPEGTQPWFFLGDMAKGNFSQWFGFRVFGQTEYSKTMPTYHIEKGTKWSGTVGHLLGFGKKIDDLSGAYKKYLNNNL